MYSMKLVKPRIVLFDPKKSEVMLNQEGRIAMDSALIEAQREIVDETPVGVSGDMRASIQTMIKIVGKIIQGIVFAGKKYALPVNFGRKASPVSKLGQMSIQRWVEKSTAGRELWGALSSKYPGISSRAVAFLVSRKKKQRRTKGQRFFDKGINKAMPEIRRIFKGMGLKMARRFVSVS